VQTSWDIQGDLVFRKYRLTLYPNPKPQIPECPAKRANQALPLQSGYCVLRLERSSLPTCHPQGVETNEAFICKELIFLRSCGVGVKGGWELYP